MFLLLLFFLFKIVTMKLGILVLGDRDAVKRDKYNYEENECINILFIRRHKVQNIIKVFKIKSHIKINNKYNVCKVM